ncbi:hypothetical protein NGRA_0117 [Nosema granulosis]|uniref:Uncharacterized protein n=1 Tax=Nosema granulosis TaxID=83296 RepID=A0A9P6H1Z3_9MICR|nr:hypothetical protein NGRA_0117 [Nosema granulosis]
MKEIENIRNTDDETPVRICKLIREKKYDVLQEIAQKHAEYCLKEKKWNRNIFSILYLNILTRNQSTNLEIMELFDVVLKRTMDCLGREMDKIDKSLLNESLKTLNRFLEQENTLELNIENIIRFLIRCMQKICKIEPSSKLLAFSALKKFMEDEKRRSMIVEQILYDFHLLSSGRVHLGSKFLLMAYEKKYFNFSISELFNMLLNESDQLLQYTEDIFVHIVSNIRQNKYASLFCLSFIKNFIEEQGTERGFGIFLRVYKEIVNSQQNSKQIDGQLIDDNTLNSFCKEVFGLGNISDVYKYYTRKAFLFCLDVISKKTHPKRTTVAKNLLKMDLSNILLFCRKRLIKTAKTLIKSDNVNIFEVGVVILAHLQNSYLIDQIEVLNDRQKKKIVFERLKSSECEIIYSLYLELLSSEDTREIEFVVGDFKKLAKAFCHFHSKEVCKYLEMEFFKVEDIYTAELALWYSKYYPSKIDAVHVVSFFLKSDRQFLISKNINFYVKLIGILSNLTGELNYSLKRKMVSILKDLLFYTPYTKEIGIFFNKIECNKFVVSSKTEYVLVVLAACNHSDFKNRFLESPWSDTKDRALVYMLSHQPTYGEIYKWRLIEILKGGDSLTILDLLRFLGEVFVCERFEEEISNFYFSFIDENQELFFNLMKSEAKCVSVQSGNLIYTAIKNKCLLAETAIPCFLSYTYSIPVDIYHYEHVILKNINQIVTNQDSNQEKLIFTLFKKIKNKKAFLEAIDCPSGENEILDRILGLFSKVFKTKYAKIILDKVRDFQITLEDGEALKKTQNFLIRNNSNEK